MFVSSSQPQCSEHHPQHPDARFALVCGNKVALLPNITDFAAGSVSALHKAHDLAVMKALNHSDSGTPVFLGYWHQSAQAFPCYALLCDNDFAEVLQSFVKWVALRELSAAINSEQFELLATAIQLEHWRNDHRFCGRCGQLTALHSSERSLLCTGCGFSAYPRISPCIIVLVHRGDHCLMARNRQFSPGKFSVIAGFVEAGEHVESAVKREVKEEVGIDVSSLQYIQSQPWPYPGQLMLGFFAEYAGGELQPDGDEIVEADWYHYQKLPYVPSQGSLSGQLIRQFVQRCEKRE